MDIGARLREMRKRSGLTLAALSEQTGLTAGFLSQLERNKVSASIDSLRAIVEQLGYTLMDLFAREALTNLVVIRRDERFIIEDEERGSRFEFLSNASPSKMVPCIARLEGGAQTNKRPSRHRGHELAVVLEGEIEYVISDEVIHLKEGDCIMFGSNVPHYCRNPADRTACWLWVSCDFS